MAAWTTGAPLGPYVLLAPIGAGGMGEVWKARDTRLNRIVAVKRLKGKHTARFEQEARAIAALNHPHICQIYDIGRGYRLVRQMVQMKNRISGQMMETGVSHNKQRTHKVGYFRELLSSNEEVHENIRPLLRLSRETIVRCQKTEYALVSSLERDPLLAGRIKRLRTVPGVGPITALTWALEIGDVSRFRSIKQAISYCGLCGEEKSSADKSIRTPLSKQRNKHIQSVLIEAAKLVPRQNHELALVHEREKQRGNGNRATLVVARKMVAYLLAVARLVLY